jgi:hypothetical protein
MFESLLKNRVSLDDKKRLTVREFMREQTQINELWPLPVAS